MGCTGAEAGGEDGDVVFGVLCVESAADRVHHVRDPRSGGHAERGEPGQGTEGGLLVVTWAHGDKLIDSGFRSDRAAEHAA
ncbi:hypothetical protein AB0B44_43640, partial [Streptomyces sp. NPDC041003]